MPTIHLSKNKSDEILQAVLEAGYPCVGVILKALQTFECDQGAEITTNEGMAQGRPHGSFSLAQEAALAELDRLRNSEQASPSDHLSNAVFIQAEEEEEVRYGVIGLHSYSTSDLSSISDQFYSAHGANGNDADLLRASTQYCE